MMTTSVYYILKVQMHLVWEILAFQPCVGDLPHAADSHCGDCESPGAASELQKVHQRSHGETKRRVLQHQSSHGESDGKN